MDSLLSLRLETSKLEKKITQLDTELQDNGKEYVKKSQEAIQLLRTVENMRKARDQIINCLLLFKKIEQIQQSVGSKVRFELLQFLYKKTIQFFLICHLFFPFIFSIYFFHLFFPFISIYSTRRVFN